jgi:hypothetical protein
MPFLSSKVRAPSSYVDPFAFIERVQGASPDFAIATSSFDDVNQAR